MGHAQMTYSVISQQDGLWQASYSGNNAHSEKLAEKILQGVSLFFILFSKPVVKLHYWSLPFKGDLFIMVASKHLPTWQPAYWTIRAAEFSSDYSQYLNMLLLIFLCVHLLSACLLCFMCQRGCCPLCSSHIQTTNAVAGTLTSSEELETKANVDFTYWQAVQTCNNNVE